VSLRNSRLLALVSRLRTAAQARYPLGAIIPSPVGMARHPHYWPQCPYAQLARRVDVFLPMAYFSHYVQRPGDVYNYTRRVVLDIREQTGRPQIPIHAIGGLASAASAAAIRAFVQAASDCGVAGASLYASDDKTSNGKNSRTPNSTKAPSLPPAPAESSLLPASSSKPRSLSRLPPYAAGS
jgi:hypothetical protein